MTDPDLTEEEVDKICKPLKQGAAKVRYLRSLGLTVTRRPNGEPLVNRLHYDYVRGGSGRAAVATVTGNGPNWSVHA